MYMLSVGNNYAYPITIQSDVVNTVNPGHSVQIEEALGNAYITVPGIGQMLVHDIGDRQIGGFSKATWGVFIAYQGEEVVFRYEGGGQIKVTFNDLGQAQLEANGGISRIDLGAFILPGE
ncbi:MAG: hypothetical protein ICV87_09530 [Gemmatimonadetes bacterium]|nr:hypothetical protein [Gemmatimonadota bacterium]